MTSPPAGPGRPLGSPGDMVCLEYSPDGRHLAGGASDGTIRIWDAGERPTAARLTRGKAGNLQYRPDGKRLISSEGAFESVKGKYRLWDATTGRQLAVLGEGDHSNFNHGASLQPRWQTGGRRERRIYSHVRCRHRPPALGRGPLGSPVDRIFFSPDGKRILVDQHHLRDGVTGELIAVLGDLQSRSWPMAIAPAARGWRRATTTRTMPCGSGIRAVGNSSARWPAIRTSSRIWRSARMARGSPRFPATRRDGSGMVKRGSGRRAPRTHERPDRPGLQPGWRASGHGVV